MTLIGIYTAGKESLKESGIREYELDAFYLLEYVTGVSRAAYYADCQREVAKEQEAQYFSLIEARKHRVPLQHLTHVQEFMGMEFYVNEHVLIPRQDTEILVETALAVIEKRRAGNDRIIRILDMCTGSGCVLLSIIRHAGGFAVDGTGIDISEEALKVARRNAEVLKIPASFLQSDLFEQAEDTYQLIVSNPPYIRTAEIEKLETEVRDYDPVLALDGKEDGLFFYRKIVDQSRQFLDPGGSLIVETGFDQGDAVLTLMQEAGYHSVTIKKDLAGLDRVVFGLYDKKND